MRTRVPVVLLTACLLAADWPGPHGPNRDNVSVEKGLNWVWPAGGPPVLWTKDIGKGFAGVAVGGKTGILFHRVGDAEIVQAFDPATGANGWKFEYATKYVDDFGFDPGPRATPVIRDGRVFTYGPNGDFHALDLATGKKLWSKNLLKEYDASKGYFGAASSPLVLPDRVVVLVGGPEAGIVAFDPATGKEIWKATGDAAGYSSPVLAKIDDKDAVVAFTRNGLRVVDPESGRLRFSYPFRSRLDASVNAATPLVAKEAIFLTASYGTGAALLKPRGADVDEEWANDSSLSSHYCTPVRVGDYVYGVHGRAEGGGAELRCIEWNTGKVRWTEKNFGCASLLNVDGGLIAVTEGGWVTRFESNSGKFVQKAVAKDVVPGPCRAFPALADGRLFVRGDGKLVCLNLNR